MENSNELRIKLYSYDYRLLDNAIKMIVGVARATSAGIKGPIPLPIKKEV
ncbi:hypothetical protein FACS189459_4520 [Bacilli bacterium]|nr:hypothetical protein FACS189459_4520 [Bacilli bacterium]